MKAKLFFLMIFVQCCNTRSTTIDENENVEEKALIYFCDSLLGNPKMFIPEPESLMLYPNNFDSIWIEKGLFFDKEIFGDPKMDDVSRPYYDAYSILGAEDIMPDSVLQRAKGYIKDFENRKKTKLGKVIRLPEKIKPTLFSDFKNDTNSNALFVKTKNYIKSDNEYTVEILSIDKQDVHRSFLIFLNDKGEVIGWNFQARDFD